jgi:hypothetical protein
LRGPVVGDVAHTFRERWNDPTPFDHRNPIRMWTPGARIGTGLGQRVRVARLTTRRSGCVRSASAIASAQLSDHRYWSST